MRTPEGCEHLSYAELLIALPPTWPINQEQVWPLQDESYYWPIRTLKMLARLPHEYDTWLGYAHTVPNGDPPRAYAHNTKLCAAMLVPPLLSPAEAWQFQATPELKIRFYAVIPLYKEELSLKLNKGSDALLERLVKDRISEIVDPTRKNVAKKFGIF
jgi:hypothetical protein